MISLEQVRRSLDQAYPQDFAVGSLAAQFNASIQDTQTALDFLAAKRFTYVTEMNTYLGAIKYTELALTTTPQNSSTISNAVAFSLQLVESHLERLVLLKRATLILAPITGEKTYVSV